MMGEISLTYFQMSLSPYQYQILFLPFLPHCLLEKISLIRLIYLYYLLSNSFKKLFSSAVRQILLMEKKIRYVFYKTFLLIY